MSDIKATCFSLLLKRGWRMRPFFTHTLLFFHLTLFEYIKDAPQFSTNCGAPLMFNLNLFERNENLTAFIVTR